MPSRPEAVDQRHAGADAELLHLLRAQAVELHDERAQGIAVADQDHALAGLELWGNALGIEGSTRAAVSFRLSPPGGAMS